ncbi:endolytic transglycosylase MltG [Microbacterium sp. NC79]|uniref:endolytic transglycosylase MltG n=1 Tax=Microbacterium sp. NC79 TaxID=2851009 RepID=UPI001C2CC3AE|nr:endolytic transglycosylase MltG [Microbacterium sp. NC79]MBV0894941.1 endolytic transglycosylase MltG [Microbacterium sp. NC79]
MTTPTNDDQPRPMSRREMREAAAHRGKAPTPVPPTAPVMPAADEVPTSSVAEPSAPAAAEVPASSPAADADLARQAAELFPSRSDVSAMAMRTDAIRTDANNDVTPENPLTDIFGDHAVAAPKKKKRAGCIVALVVLLALLGGATAGGFWVWNTYGDKIQDFLGMGESKDYEAGIAEGEVMFTIQPGDGGLQISYALHEAGVTKTDEIFYDWLRENPPTPTFYPGTYKLQQKMTAAAAVEVLGNVDNKLANAVLLREGETLQTILPTIADSLQIPIEDLQAATADPSVYGVSAATLEGWLFPATYEFNEGVTANDVITTMVNRTLQSLDSAGVPVEERQRILTVAAIIQREAGAGDMGKVAQVIYNRLGPENTETFGLLQMDSTVAYGVGKLHDGVVATTDADRANDNPYNTYLHPGLPAGPIANSGDEAIDAAMHPEPGPWFYFVTVNLNTGETVFSETYAQQLEAEALWHDWCEENPDSGCYD